MSRRQGIRAAPPDEGKGLLRLFEDPSKAARLSVDAILKQTQRSAYKCFIAARVRVGRVLAAVEQVVPHPARGMKGALGVVMPLQRFSFPVQTWPALHLRRLTNQEGDGFSKRAAPINSEPTCAVCGKPIPVRGSVAAALCVAVAMFFKCELEAREEGEELTHQIPLDLQAIKRGPSHGVSTQVRSAKTFRAKRHPLFSTLFYLLTMNPRPCRRGEITQRPPLPTSREFGEDHPALADQHDAPCAFPGRC